MEKPRAADRSAKSASGLDRKTNLVAFPGLCCRRQCGEGVLWTAQGGEHWDTVHSQLNVFIPVGQIHTQVFRDSGVAPSVQTPSPGVSLTAAGASQEQAVTCPEANRTLLARTSSPLVPRLELGISSWDSPSGRSDFT